MTISANFPNVQPSLLLDFANAKQLPPSVNFTRATTAAYYDGSTTAMAEQNLFTYSQNSTTNWTNFSNRLTITTSYETAPDGTNTGMRLQNSSGSIGYFYQNVGSNLFVSGTTYALSVWVKSNTGATQTAQLMLPVTSAVTNVTVTTSWTRVSWVTAASSTNSFAGIILDPATATDISVWGFQVEQRSAVTAYTATTTQPITNYIPVLLTAGGGQPRFDHNPTTSESLGLLIEEQRTNVLPYSSDYSDASWGKTAITVQSNVVVAPDGTLTGDKLVANTTNTQHFISRSVSITGGVTYTWSAYAKQGEYVGFQLNRLDVGGVAASFNLSTGAVISVAGGTASMQSVGNGWYRCIFVFTPPGTTSMSAGLQPINPSGGGANFAGNDFSGVYVWGAQFETGSFPTSYIPTTSASATRAADTASMTGANFASWYNQAEGTVYADGATYPSAPSYSPILEIDNTANAAGNRYSFGVQSFSSVPQVNLYTLINDSIQVNGITSGGQIMANGVSGRAAFVYKVNDFAISGNGATVATDTSGLITPSNQLLIGKDFSDRYWNGYLKKVAYYPVRVTNAQLQALTS